MAEEKVETAGPVSGGGGGTEEFDPFKLRQVEKPTNDIETLMHLLKGSLGSGLMAIPFAFAQTGLTAGIFCTIITGFLTTYCVYMLIDIAHRLQYRNRVTKFSFNETFEAALLVGPNWLKKCSKAGSVLVDIFLVIDLYGCCVIYTVTFAKNIKQVVDTYVQPKYMFHERLYMLMGTPFLIGLGCVRYLKYLAPLSAIANIFMIACMIILFYYVFEEWHHPSKVKQFESITKWPVFFGVCIFSLENIGVAMPLENNMKFPPHFIRKPWILQVAMSFVIVLYTVTGFLGYLRFGGASAGSITLNFPEGWPGQTAKVLIALAIMITYGLQFYVPFECIWKHFRVMQWVIKRPLLYEYLCRILTVLITVAMAIGIPNIGGFIGLIGALCLSFLGLIFPALGDYCVNYDAKTLGKIQWKLLKNIFIMIFGFLGCCFGVYISGQEIYEDLKPQK